MSENKSKNIVIIALCITLIFMGVGFSLLSQTLTINGTASTTGSWDIEIDSFVPVKARYKHTDITDSTELGTKFGNVSGTTLNAANNVLGSAYKTSNTTAAFNALLNEPGDYVIYKVVVGNHGSINAVLASSTAGITMDNNYDPHYAQAAGGNAVFTVSFVTDQYADTTLETLIQNATTLTAGNTGENGQAYYVKVLYNPPIEDLATASSQEARTTISFTFEQPQS